MAKEVHEPESTTPCEQLIGWNREDERAKLDLLAAKLTTFPEDVFGKSTRSITEPLSKFLTVMNRKHGRLIRLQELCGRFIDTGDTYANLLLQSGCTVTPSGQRGSNVRQGPGIRYPTVGRIAHNSATLALARVQEVPSNFSPNEPNWTRVKLDDGQIGWVADSTVTFSSQCSSIPVVTYENLSEIEGLTDEERLAELLIGLSFYCSSEAMFSPSNRTLSRRLWFEQLAFVDDASLKQLSGNSFDVFGMTIDVDFSWIYPLYFTILGLADLAEQSEIPLEAIPQEVVSARVQQEWQGGYEYWRAITISQYRNLPTDQRELSDRDIIIKLAAIATWSETSEGQYGIALEWIYPWTAYNYWSHTQNIPAFIVNWTPIKIATAADYYDQQSGKITSFGYLRGQREGIGFTAFGAYADVIPCDTGYCFSWSRVTPEVVEGLNFTETNYDRIFDSAERAADYYENGMPDPTSGATIAVNPIPLPDDDIPGGISSTSVEEGVDVHRRKICEHYFATRERDQRISSTIHNVSNFIRNGEYITFQFSSTEE